jgi:hypothetical protein
LQQTEVTETIYFSNKLLLTNLRQNRKKSRWRLWRTRPIEASSRTKSATNRRLGLATERNLNPFYLTCTGCQVSNSSSQSVWRALPHFHIMSKSQKSREKVRFLTRRPNANVARMEPMITLLKRTPVFRVSHYPHHQGHALPQNSCICILVYDRITPPFIHDRLIAIC